MKSNNNNIRSKKVRQLLGEIPSSLTRLGIIIILIIFVALLFTIFFLPYPYSADKTIIQYIIDKM